ncbi:serine/threonine protein kinase [Stanieria cyanosphaera PCC 7437]|uniref:non-specific serine/threonine protein kinase n=1 Tax=Stanieria cyanosphaera (strain ATCC 29371 / PCC 7437) TaxID=111780 RepID=K9XTL1_STAC7|nr:serine/threonine-protein kinase [Stanieria cyanosphaera]AFZ35399.1 serine/threonine protein kinase [Stanieria cyanosphaera PCC 7437]
MDYLSEILPGTLIERRYRVKRTIGQGGMGRTYLVADEQRFNKLCVLKEFAPRDLEASFVNKSRELFEREARVLNKIDHPQIPKFLGWFTELGRLLLVQEYIDGYTYAELLQQRQQEGKTFSETEVIQWLKDLLPVLSYIHAHNIIHRDISPDNIMLPIGSDKPMLIDFGLVNKQAITQLTASHNSLQIPTAVGKIGYSPSEQINEGKYYFNSDLYALAVTALVLLIGKHPQTFFDNFKLKWYWQDFVTIREDFGNIIDKMLARVPQERYQSAQEVLMALSTISTDNFAYASLTPTTFLEPFSDNYSLENTVEPVKNKTKKTQIIVLICLVFSIISVILAWHSPYINGLCNIFNNCVKKTELE